MGGCTVEHIKCLLREDTNPTRGAIPVPVPTSMRSASVAASSGKLILYGPWTHIGKDTGS